MNFQKWYYILAVTELTDFQYVATWVNIEEYPKENKVIAPTT